MNIVLNLRPRLNRIVAAAIGAFFVGLCGALLAFVLSPQQALQARRIERLPSMTAEDLAAAAPGDDVLLTGRLEDNPVVAPDGFVAYTRERWQISQSTPGSQSGSPSATPGGRWETVERVVPDLALSVGGRTVSILRADGVALSGALHERLVRATSSQKAGYDGQLLAEGSERLRGFYNGDLVTVLGNRASTGDVIPDELFAGDRVAFVAQKKSAARGLFVGGLCLMGLAPVVLVGGVLAGLFGRRRR